jgi:hypothetical protein
MPFGFDPIQVEQDLKNYVEIQKIYVQVKMLHKKTGQIIPLSFTWDDGREFNIDKVLDIRQGHSLKAFSPGWRYRCQTGKRIYYLHYDTERWYIEKNNP